MCVRSSHTSKQSLRIRSNTHCVTAALMNPLDAHHNHNTHFSAALSFGDVWHLAFPWKLSSSGKGPPESRIAYLETGPSGDSKVQIPA